MTSFIDLVQKRYSVRSYRRDPIPNDVLQRVLQAAVLAPTAANRQSFRLYVVATAGREEELKRIYSRDWFTAAPYVICGCSIPAGNWVRRDGKNYSDVDIAIVFDHLILAAADEGLGTCWIGAFDPLAAREVLRLPESEEPVLFTPLGFPADQPTAKRRKPMSELVTFV